MIERLEALGFDACSTIEDHGVYRGVRLGCSQCEALSINGTPCHETGCPNARHECHGCNAMIPVRQRYCDDCA